MLWGIGESSKKAAVDIAAADLDAHFAGPPTTGPLSVAELDRLANWSKRYTIFDEIVTANPPAASFNLGIDLPANATAISFQVNLNTAISKTGLATKVGLGTSATADLFGKTLNLLKNSKINTAMGATVLNSTAPTDIRLFSVNNSGTPTGTIGGPGQMIRVRLIYISLEPLPDVA